MSQKTIRHNEGKLEWTLVDFKSLEPLVRVLMYGKDKYSRDNWKLGGQTKEDILNSLLRHALALVNGEETDPEHGISHIGGVLFNAMMYEYYKNNGKWK